MGHNDPDGVLQMHPTPASQRMKRARPLGAWKCPAQPLPLTPCDPIYTLSRRVLRHMEPNPDAIRTPLLHARPQARSPHAHAVSRDNGREHRRDSGRGRAGSGVLRDNRQVPPPAARRARRRPDRVDRRLGPAAAGCRTARSARLRDLAHAAREHQGPRCGEWVRPQPHDRRRTRGTGPRSGGYGQRVPADGNASATRSNAARSR